VWWVEIGLLAAVLALYVLLPSSARPAPERFAAAERNAAAVVGLEERLGLDVEPEVQDAVLELPALVVAANVAYGTLHFLLTPAVLVAVFHRARGRYSAWRTSLAVSSLVAFCCYRWFPVAPPRLSGGPGGGPLLEDTLATHPTLWSFDSALIEAAADPVAAVPSMHAGWALWCALALGATVRRWWARLALLVYPVGVLAVIVVTGNHYVVDGLAGFAVVGLAAAAVLVGERLSGSSAPGRRERPASGSRAARLGADRRGRECHGKHAAVRPAHDHAPVGLHRNHPVAGYPATRRRAPHLDALHRAPPTDVSPARYPLRRRRRTVVARFPPNHDE
jgi:hypothetical protein